MKIISNVRRWQFIVCILNPDCFASVPGNIAGPGASAITTVVKFRISIVFWLSLPSDARTGTDLMSVCAASLSINLIKGASDVE